MSTKTPVTASRAPLPAGRILLVLTLANVMNMYDRTVPAIVVEPLKAEFGLSDVQVGLLSSAFTVVYAIAGIFLGRLADKRSRRLVMAGGLVVWSVFTALSGGAWSFASLLIFRLGVGIGEASYAPAANSMIFDSYPTQRRARAVSIFQLGIPVGLLLAFVTVGAIVQNTGSWRLPFFIAAVPGIIIAIVMIFLPEPRRGGADVGAVSAVGAVGGQPDRPLRRIARVATLRWLILAGIGTQVATYAVATFLVPLLQRYFELSIGIASLGAGLILGVAGIIGLLLGGQIADRASKRSLRARLVVGAIAVGIAVPLVLCALLVPPSAPWAFIALFALGTMFANVLGTASLPAIADVVEPRIRATAVAIYFAAFYLLGGAFGPIITGLLSDSFAASAGASSIPPEAFGLHQAMLITIPIAYLLAAVASIGASRVVIRDNQRMIATSVEEAAA
jgi:MFS family permease